MYEHWFWGSEDWNRSEVNDWFAKNQSEFKQVKKNFESFFLRKFSWKKIPIFLLKKIKREDSSLIFHRALVLMTKEFWMFLLYNFTPIITFYNNSLFSACKVKFSWKYSLKKEWKINCFLNIKKLRKFSEIKWFHLSDGLKVSWKTFNYLHKQLESFNFKDGFTWILKNSLLKNFMINILKEKSCMKKISSNNFFLFQNFLLNCLKSHTFISHFYF